MAINNTKVQSLAHIYILHSFIHACIHSFNTHSSLAFSLLGLRNKTLMQHGSLGPVMLITLEDMDAETDNDDTV